MAGSTSLQQRLENCLFAVGYGGKVGRLSPEVAGNERLASFMEWVMREALQPDNHLSTSELERFAEVKSSGRVLEGCELERALACQDSTKGGETCEDIRGEIADLQRTKAPLQAHLQTLSTVQNSLSDHHATLLHRRDDLTRRRSETQRNYQKAMEAAEHDNSKVNEALGELGRAVDETAAFHRGTEESATPTFLSAVPQDPYHTAEDQFLAELTAYTKKQFFKGIAVMAHSPAASEYGLVDLGSADNTLLKGGSRDDFQRHHQELIRLQSIYPLVEVQRVNDLVAEQHALGAFRRAMEEMEALAEEIGGQLHVDHDTLRQRMGSKQAEVAELRSRIHALGQTELSSLLQDMSVLQVTKVLHGDYALKIARQDYFTSKQDKVIGRLLTQRARSELLSMLYEVELRRHRETHRLLAATQAQLSRWREGREKRTEAMQSTAVLPAKAVRQTIDSRDLFALRLCTLLGVQPSAGLLITHSSLVAAAKQLAHQLATLEGLVKSLDAEQLRLVQDVDLLASQLEVQVYGCSGGGMVKPRLTNKAFEDECCKARSVVATLEQNIKALLKIYDSKKKVLQGNPLTEEERKLFVHFFTNPSKLTQAVAELAGRVDATAQAKQLQTQ